LRAGVSKWLRWLRSWRGLVLAICCVALIASCANDAKTIRKATYPPQFRYISDDEIASVMWRLAGRVHELERQTELESPDPVALSALLRQIESEARRLDSGEAGSNHPYLHSKLEDFLQIVARARLDLQRDPPRIATADEVWLACSGCHVGP
jgi:hypothetical protein